MSTYLSQVPSLGADDAAAQSPCCGAALQDGRRGWGGMHQGRAAMRGQLSRDPATHPRTFQAEGTASGVYQPNMGHK